MYPGAEENFLAGRKASERTPVPGRQKNWKCVGMANENFSPGARYYLH